jgi:TPR repeat protein
MAAALVAGVFLGAPGAKADFTDGAQAASRTSMEAGIRMWRKAAWQDDDFLSEIKLGDIYGDERGTNRYNDPVEAYVWYFLATKSTRVGQYAGDVYARRILANNVYRALKNQQKLLVLMSGDDRADARNRIIYVLSCRGADGFVQLGQIHARNRGEFNRPYRYRGFQIDNWTIFSAMSDAAQAHSRFDDRSQREFDEGEFAAARQMMGVNSNSVIIRNDGEALIYFHIAENMGHPMGREYLRGLDAAVRGQPGWGQRVAQEANDKARVWYPPLEFYPAGDVQAGLPYTDECIVNFDKQRALMLVNAGLPPNAVSQALKFLGWNRGKGDIQGIQKFQQTIANAPTGKLTAPEAVRLVQTAALRGDAGSQNALGIMYAKGIGVIRNYVRAQYWFQKAADQRYGAALYHLGVLYKVGPPGIRQDLSKSNDYMTASALAGFRPTLNQLNELLARAASTPRPGDR